MQTLTGGERRHLNDPVPASGPNSMAPVDRSEWWLHAAPRPVWLMPSPPFISPLFQPISKPFRVIIKPVRGLAMAEESVHAVWGCMHSLLGANGSGLIVLHSRLQKHADCCVRHWTTAGHLVFWQIGCNGRGLAIVEESRKRRRWWRGRTGGHSVTCGKAVSDIHK